MLWVIVLDMSRDRVVQSLTTERRLSLFGFVWQQKVRELELLLGGESGDFAAQRLDPLTVRAILKHPLGPLRPLRGVRSVWHGCHLKLLFNAFEERSELPTAPKSEALGELVVGAASTRDVSKQEPPHGAL
jgi:hypothetical protein